MKKLNLWLLASLFVAAFTLCACGDDDDSGSPAPTPTSVVGTWDAFIKASNPDDMALRYSHKLTYVFNQDGTFKIRTIYGEGQSSEQFHGEETVVFSGKYVANNGKLQFSDVTYLLIMWDKSKDRGDLGKDLILNYSLSGNTLTIGSDDPNMVRFGYHHILVGTLTKSSGDIDDDKTPEVTEAKLKGIWDGSLEQDFAQGYLQRWRIQFDGKNYTSWHTHQTVGTIYDEPGLKTVGNKEKGTWKYDDGVLVLTPTNQYASYVITSMDPMKHTFYNYNPETMECDEWYETPEILIQEGIERDLQDGTDFYISKWPVVGFTDSELSIKVNMDVFVLKKQ